MIATLTSNQFYRGLNRRFERRAAVLASVGFKYVIHEYGACFERDEPCRRPARISVEMIQHAHNRVWNDSLRRILHQSGLVGGFWRVR